MFNGNPVFAASNTDSHSKILLKYENEMSVEYLPQFNLYCVATVGESNTITNSSDNVVSSGEITPNALPEKNVSQLFNIYFYTSSGSMAAMFAITVDGVYSTVLPYWSEITAISYVKGGVLANSFTSSQIISGNNATFRISI